MVSRFARTQFGLWNAVSEPFLPDRRRESAAFRISRSLAVLGLVVTAQAAQAEIVQISATSLVERGPYNSPEANLRNGVLEDSIGRFYATVPFPAGGGEVCRFSLIYRDINDNDTMSAYLVKKPFKIGGNAFNRPVIMAEVQTADGVVATVRRASTTSVRQRAIDTADAFYYVEVDMVSINIDVLGLQVDVRPNCP